MTPTITKRTEKELVEALIGKTVVVEERTHAGGIRTIVGAIVAPLGIEETPEGETATHATVEGMITTETIGGLPTPITVEKEARRELLPLHAIRIL